MRYGFLAFLVVLLALPGCFGGETKQVPVKLRLINVLDKKLFDDAHIKGSDGVASINVKMEELESAASDWDKTTPTVAYCSNYFCTASGDAAQKLTELGFTDVWAYEAGMAEWYQLSKNDKNYAIEGGAQQPYLKVVIPKPKKDHGDIRIITSQELQKKMKEATMLDSGVNS